MPSEVGLTGNPGKNFGKAAAGRVRWIRNPKAETRKKAEVQGQDQTLN